MQGSVSTETSVADPVRHLVQGPFFTSARAWQAQSAMPLERCCAVPECYCLDLVGFPPCRFGRVHAYWYFNNLFKQELSGKAMCRPLMNVVRRNEASSVESTSKLSFKSICNKAAPPTKAAAHESLKTITELKGERRFSSNYGPNLFACLSGCFFWRWRSFAWTFALGESLPRLFAVGGAQDSKTIRLPVDLEPAALLGSKLKDQFVPWAIWYELSCDACPSDTSGQLMVESCMVSFELPFWRTSFLFVVPMFRGQVGTAAWFFRGPAMQQIKFKNKQAMISVGSPSVSWWSYQSPDTWWFRGFFFFFAFHFLAAKPLNSQTSHEAPNLASIHLLLHPFVGLSETMLMIKHSRCSDPNLDA